MVVMAVVVVREEGGVVKGEFAVEEGEDKGEEEEDEGGRVIQCEWVHGLGLVVVGLRNIMGIFHLILRFCHYR